MLPDPLASPHNLELEDYSHEKAKIYVGDTLKSRQIYAHHRNHDQSYETTHPLPFFLTLCLPLWQFPNMR